MIPTINKQSLSKCIEAIDKTISGCSVFVIDNSKGRNINTDLFVMNNNSLSKINNYKYETTCVGGRKLGLDYAAENGFDYCFFLDDDCICKKNSIDRILYFLVANKSIPYVGSIGNYNCFLRLPDDVLKRTFVLNISCDVLFGINVRILKKRHVSFDIKSGTRNSAELCLQLMKLGYNTGMIYAPISHRLDGTKVKTKENYFSFTEYVSEKHSDIIKHNKKYRFLFKSKFQRMYQYDETTFELCR
jgi:hypothetical protein